MSYNREIMLLINLKKYNLTKEVKPLKKILPFWNNNNNNNSSHNQLRTYCLNLNFGLF